MSKASSKISRCVVSPCESTTIARPWSCFARVETESAGACVKTTTGMASAIGQRTFLIPVSFLYWLTGGSRIYLLAKPPRPAALTLATQGDDRVHSGRAPRREVARQKYNHHQDQRHRYKHFRIKRSNSVEQT